MRRHRQELEYSESVAILQEATSGVLGLIGDGGYPYTVPMSHVYHDGSLYFHSAVSGHKLDAAKRESRCSFCVINRDEVKPSEFTTYFRSAIAFGKITVIEDPQEKLKALRLLGERFGPGDEEQLRDEIDGAINRVTVMRMDIEHLTGKEAIELVRARTQ